MLENDFEIQLRMQRFLALDYWYWTNQVVIYAYSIHKNEYEYIIPCDTIQLKPSIFCHNNEQKT